MSTEELISVIRSKSHEPNVSSYKKAIAYVLYKKGVSSSQLEKIFGTNRKGVLFRVYSMIDLLNSGDRFCVESMAEFDRHQIEVDNEWVKTYSRKKCVVHSVKIDGVVFYESTTTNNK